MKNTEIVSPNQKNLFNFDPNFFFYCGDHSLGAIGFCNKYSVQELNETFASISRFNYYKETNISNKWQKNHIMIKENLLSVPGMNKRVREKSNKNKSKTA